MLDVTIQESEFHKNYAEEMKEKVLQPIHDIRVKLSKEKENWLYAMETLKKNLVAVQEKMKQEQLKLKGITQEIEAIKERKRKAMANIGLDPNEEIALENMPADIQRLERALIDKTKKKKEVTDTCEASNTSASQAEEMYKEKMKRILGIIEQDEAQRISVVRQVLKASNEVYTRMLKRKSTLCEMAGNIYGQVNPFSDLQGYIRKDSLCSTSEEELRRLYKSLGEELVVLGKDKAAAPVERSLSKKSLEVNQQHLLADKVKKETATLKHLRIRVGKVEELYRLYPNTTMLKRLSVHADLRCEDLGSIRAFIYLLYRFAAIISATKTNKPGLFRSTLVEKGIKPSDAASLAKEGQEKPKDAEKEKEQEKQREKEKAKEKEKKEMLVKMMVGTWGIPESQVSYVTELLKVGGDGFKLRAESLRSGGLHFALIFLLQKWQRVLSLQSQGEKEKQDDKTMEMATPFFRAVYSFAWGYVFWQVFSKVSYKDDEFESECGNLVQLLEFNSYMSEASLVNNLQFAEYTIRTLQSLAKTGRYDLTPSTPASLSLFRSFVGPFLVDEKEKRLLPAEFDQLMDDVQPLCEVLGVEHEWSFVYLINYIGETFLTTTDFTKPNEGQTRAIHGLLSIKKHLEGNYVTFIAAGRLKPADFLAPTSSAPGEDVSAPVPPTVTEFQLHEKVQKAGVLFTFSDRIHESLLDFRRNFGTCVNKLRAILDIGRLVYTLCYTLIDEPTYDKQLEEALETNGQHLLDTILEKHKRPFVLQGKEGETCTTISDILTVFQEEIERFVDLYFSVWHEYVSRPQSNFSKPMREVLIKDLQSQAAQLSVDSNCALFTRVSVALNDFDQLCQAPHSEATTSALLPNVQSWFEQKSALIGERMRRAFAVEQWNTQIIPALPKTGGALYTNSAVDIAHHLFHTVETLKQFIGDKSLSVWPGAIKEFVANVVKDYCDETMKTCQCDKQFLPGPLPTLLLANRSTRRESKPHRRKAAGPRDPEES